MKIVILKYPFQKDWSEIEKAIVELGCEIIYAKVIPQDKRAQITLVDRDTSPLFTSSSEDDE